MNLHEAEQMARSIIREQLDADWSFRWNNRKRAFGVCHYRKKTIQLSTVLTATEPEHKVRDTVLHEVAHALAGASAKHGPRWREMARAVGATPRACATPTVTPQYAWVIKHGDQVVKGYFNRPSRRVQANIPNMWVKGRPETKGQLHLEKVG